MNMVKKSLTTFNAFTGMLPKKKSGSAVNLKNLKILKTLIILMSLTKPISRVMPNRGRISRERVGRMAIKSMIL